MNFPAAFESRVTNDPFLGKDLLNALNATPPVTIRLNPLKLTEREAADYLDANTSVQWCRHAFYLAERPSFTLDPLFHAGCYYPQEAGSMVLDTVLTQLELPQEPAILDLCAAPGGKSTLIASHLNGSGLLVSNEVIQARARILRENMTKWGYSNVVVTNNDPADFDKLSAFFDLIVIDAPCSGEGMFRKDPDSRNEWSEDNVLLCAARQKRIIADVWDAVKPGGYVVYSTCTFNEQENEENVRFMLDEMQAELVEINLHEHIQKGRQGLGHYCIPGITETEGFFIAVLQKAGADSKKQRYDIRRDLRHLNPGKDLEVLKGLAKTEDYSFYQWNDLVMALPSAVADRMQHVIANTRVVKAGTLVGELNRKGILPHEELAVCIELNSFPERIELSKQQALQYLHGDTFYLESNQGLKLITYRNKPLGWIKHLGNRFNNLYPKEWRIRMNIS